MIANQRSAAAMETARFVVLPHDGTIVGDWVILRDSDRAGLLSPSRVAGDAGDGRAGDAIAGDLPVFHPVLPWVPGLEKVACASAGMETPARLRL